MQFLLHLKRGGGIVWARSLWVLRQRIGKEVDDIEAPLKHADIQRRDDWRTGTMMDEYGKE